MDEILLHKKCRWGYRLLDNIKSSLHPKVWSGSFKRFTLLPNLASCLAENKE